ncbi:helix-turn-helix transcriptional regulator [Nocardioides bruguierae]|uniref:helix-turn-helix transcriptional regulator n=1 Tax=Nocardioides bruguierae TaxID=2945102 RepID=UPI0020218228|nr:response regulator transcription factor [Nocardioides bruguierae]MCL8025996.1 response regulator transcription factor [Nocardioides bruguierae]
MYVPRLSRADLDDIRAVVTECERADGSLPLPWTVVDLLTRLLRTQQWAVFATSLRTGSTWFTQGWDMVDGRYVMGVEYDTEHVQAHPLYWQLACSLPERTGDLASIWTDDLMRTVAGDRALRESADLAIAASDGSADAAPPEGYEMMMCSLLEPAHQLRVLAVLDDPVRERDLFLLELLRPHLVQGTARWRRAHPPSLGLTARQVEILSRVRDGLTNRQIARRMDLSEGTVRTHLNHVYSRLGATSRTDAVRRFFETDPRTLLVPEAVHHDPYGPSLSAERG